MKLRSYLAAEVLRHTMAVSVVLFAIIVIGRFVKYLADAAAGKLATDILLAVMWYRLPGFLELLLPLGFFIGTLLAYGRLYVDSEMVVLGSCGIGPGQLLRITLVPAAGIALLVALLALAVAPRGAERSAALLAGPRALDGLQILAAGRFQSRGDDGAVTYAARIDRDAGRLYRVFAWRPRPSADQPSRASVVVARSGRVVRHPQTGRRYLELEDGMRYLGRPGHADFQELRFARYGERLPDDGVAMRAQPLDARPTRLLLGSAVAAERAALHWRLSLVAMVPVVAVLALALSRTSPRRGRYLALAPALLLHLAYLFILAGIRARAAEQGMGVAAFWGVHAAFLMLGLALLAVPAVRLHPGR